MSQPFNAWFFPTLQASPYTTWFHYYGYTWLGGPYSLLWYALYAPARFGYWGFYPYIWTSDLLFGLLLLKLTSKPWTVYWLTISSWFVLVDPIDWWIVAFTFLGRKYWPFLILAPATKLPVGAPFWVWSWVLENPNSLQGPENWGRYGVLGIIWLISVFLYVEHRYEAKKAVVLAGKPRPSAPPRLSEVPVDIDEGAG